MIHHQTCSIHKRFIRRALAYALYGTVCSILRAQDMPRQDARLQKSLVEAHKNNDIPSTLLLLKLITDDAVAKGAKAPDYNLCDLTVEGTTLLCGKNKGIPRLYMPQLSGKPIPGSLADQLPRNKRGEVDATNNFSYYLTSTKKYSITKTRIPVTELHATQNEIIGSKVAGIWAAMQDKKSPFYYDIMNQGLFVSNDNYILDGHHRWAAAVARAISSGTLYSTTIVVNVVDAPIDQLVKDANEFAQQFGIQAETGNTEHTP